MSADTSAEAVERLARLCEEANGFTLFDCSLEIAATLRALVAERDRLAEAVRALDAAHAQAAREVERLTAEVAAREAAAAEAMRDIAAETAREACLVPPDGGSPNADEVEVCDEAERRIRALPFPAADALARALDQARAEEREACAQEVDCGCAARADVLARLATDGEKRASYLCVHGDVCCALQAAAIRARGKEPQHDR